MKRFLLISACLIAINSFSQGITGFTMQPANPTTADSITIYAHVWFGNSNCDVLNQGHSLIGNDIMASAMHCQGALTVICNTTDTFAIGYLPAGAYVFDFTLSSGFGGPPCTPGITPDDQDTMMFDVTSAVGITEPTGQNVTLYPNPATEVVLIESETALGELLLTDLTGRVVTRISATGNRTELPVANIPEGMYLLLGNGINERIMVAR